MTILTKARRIKFIKSGGEYPGFMNFSGNYEGIENRGLMMFTGTVIINQHPDNAGEIDIRKNPTGWCFGSEVDIKLQDDNGNYVHPICLPKLFVKSGFYSPIDLQLQLEVGDILSVYENYNTDYWRNPEEESPEETDNLEAEEPGKYWWEKWQKKGEKVGIQILFSAIATHLRLTYQGSLSGEMQQPWALSGNLVGAMADLAYKSDLPSFIWSNHLGVVKIAPINLTKPVTEAYSVLDLADYQPIRSSPPLISQLIFSAKVLEKKESDAIVEINDQGFGRFCNKSQTYGPIGTINGTSDISETLYAEEETCEEIYPNLKRITTTRRELKCLVFPDIKTERSVMIDSYLKIHLQKFSDTENNRLYREEITEKEPWGKVFREFYDNHANWVIDDIDLGSEDILSPPPPFPDEAMFYDRMIVSYEEIKKYKYDPTGKVSRIDTEIKEPESKILTDVVYESRYMSARRITASTIVEKWLRWGQNQRSEKNERTIMQRKYKDLLEKREEYLAETNVLSSGGGSTVYGAPTIVVATYLRQGNAIVYGSEDIPQSMVLRSERLALVNERPTGISSREGNAEGGATEYLPNVEEVGGTSDDFEEKPIFTRRSWDSPCLNPVVPAREIIELGLVPNRAYLERMADLLFALRQGQSFSYEGLFAMSQEWLTGTFEPMPRIDIAEPDGTTYVYLGHGITIDISNKENLLNIDLLWLGNT